MRSPARRFVGHRRRPHISRIERRRGPVSRYGESAERLLIVDPRGAVWRVAGAIAERFDRSAAGVWTARTVATTTGSRLKQAGGERTKR